MITVESIDSHIGPSKCYLRPTDNQDNGYILNPCPNCQKHEVAITEEPPGTFAFASLAPGTCTQEEILDAPLPGDRHLRRLRALFPHVNGAARTVISVEQWQRRLEVLARHLMQAKPELHQVGQGATDAISVLVGQLYEYVHAPSGAKDKAPDDLPDGEQLLIIEQAIRNVWEPFRRGDRSDLMVLDQVARNGVAHRQSAEDETLRVFDMGETYDVLEEFERRPWIWQGILPHKSLSLLVGKSESGKSTIAYGLIYSILRGISYFGRKCEAGRVLYLAADAASELVLAKTMRGLGVGREEGLKIVAGSLAMYKDGLDQLRGIVREFQPSLIVADTLGATINSSTEDYVKSIQSQQPLVKLARDFDPNVLMLHHSQKQAIDTYSVIDAALGTVGIAAVASTRMGTKLYKRGTQKFFTFEMSDLRIGEPIAGEWIVHKRDSGLMELGGLWADYEGELTRQAIMEVVRNQCEPPTATEIRDRASFRLSKRQMYRALYALIRDHWIEEVPSGRKGGGKAYALGAGPRDPFAQNQEE